VLVAKGFQRSLSLGTRRWVFLSVWGLAVLSQLYRGLWTVHRL